MSPVSEKLITFPHNKFEQKCKWHATEWRIDAHTQSFPTTANAAYGLRKCWQCVVVAGRVGVVMGQWGRVYRDEKTLIKALSISVTLLAALTTSCNDHGSATAWGETGRIQQRQWLHHHALFRLWRPCVSPHAATQRQKRVFHWHPRPQSHACSTAKRWKTRVKSKRQRKLHGVSELREMCCAYLKGGTQSDGRVKCRQSIFSWGAIVSWFEGDRGWCTTCQTQVFALNPVQSENLFSCVWITKCCIELADATRSKIQLSINIDSKFLLAYTHPGSPRVAW